MAVTSLFLLTTCLACALLTCTNYFVAADVTPEEGSITQHAGWPECESRALQASGYIDVPCNGGTKHFFYWLFGPRRVSSTEAAPPVVLWLTGGPGCSSGIALLQENGPCLMNEQSGNLERNPFSWNDESYLLYVDQPVGTGYSYSDGEASHVSTEAEVADDMYRVLQEFAATFSEPSINIKNPLYITGESYAGHYIPAIAHRIVEGNQRGDGLFINLKGVAIGNGWTNPAVQDRSSAYYAYYYCSQVLGQPCVSRESYRLMMTLQPACEAMIERCLEDPKNDNADCIKALDSCGEVQQYYLDTGRNPYDIRRPCEGALCYNMTNTFNFFNNPKVKASLGVSESLKWEECSDSVGMRFVADISENFDYMIADILESGIRVLIYAGDMDYICNFIGNQMWVNELNWTGREEFLAAPENQFLVGQRWAGSEKRSGLLSFVRVYAAGHMVPMDQPEVGLFMLQHFLSGESLTQQ